MNTTKPAHALLCALTVASFASSFSAQQPSQQAAPAPTRQPGGRAPGGPPPPGPPIHVPILLWPNGAPNSEGKTDPEKIIVNNEGEQTVTTIHHPSITPYLPRPDVATGAAVVIAPGGGHYMLSIDMEGYNVARWLAGHGVAAFVLKNRLAREKGSTYTIEGDELVDIQRAIRIVKSRAAEWSIDPDRVGVMGFSAGGQLAALASSLYDAPVPPGADPIDSTNAKPAFQALIYPNIPKEMKLNKDTPPAFLLCGADDGPGITLPLAQLFIDMKKAGISVEIHEYTHVGHGFGLRLSNRGPFSEWPSMFLAWLDTDGFLKKK